MRREGESRVTREIEPVILSGLKTLLETGEDLDTPGSLRYSGAAGSGPGTGVSRKVSMGSGYPAVG